MSFQRSSKLVKQKNVKGLRKFWLPFRFRVWLFNKIRLTSFRWHSSVVICRARSTMAVAVDSRGGDDKCLNAHSAAPTELIGRYSAWDFEPRRPWNGSLASRSPQSLDTCFWEARWVLCIVSYDPNVFCQVSQIHDLFVKDVIYFHWRISITPRKPQPECPECHDKSGSAQRLCWSAIAFPLHKLSEGMGMLIGLEWTMGSERVKRKNRKGIHFQINPLIFHRFKGIITVSYTLETFRMVWNHY